MFILSTPNRLTSSPDGILNSIYHVKEYDYKTLKTFLKKHFSKVEIYGQNKKFVAENSQIKFFKVQEKRQALVDVDLFRFRKLFPKKLKEYIWKYFSLALGNAAQSKITPNDFVFSKKNPNKADYFFAVCSK